MNIRKLVKALIPRRLFGAIEPYGHLAEAVVFNIAYGFPARSLKVIGVTGTNGKTTASFMIHRMLLESGYKAGVMTTVAYGVGENIRPQGAHMTNVPAPLLLKRLKRMKSEGAQWLVMETTSHALAQNRVWGIPYSLAVLTNITPEHLDYHGTFKRYLNAKLKLFKLADRNHGGLRTGVINADDPECRRFEKVVEKPITYGINAGELRASDIKTGSGGSEFTIHSLAHEDLKLHIKLNLPGEFNVYNALAAAATGLTLGLQPEQIERGIAALKSVEGRMTAIDEGQPFGVIVDYAHTPDALKNVLTAAKQLTKGQVAIVFGAAGDRDKTNRPLMGEVVAGLADRIFLTDDETYTEDPEAMRQAVFRGIKKGGGEKKTVIVPDRLEAIRQAFAAANTGDTVLLTGIGHQKDRNMGGKLVPWDEIQIAREILKQDS